MLADDIIYNRFDIVFSEYTEVQIDNKLVQMHSKDDYIEVNLWGKEIDEVFLEKLVEYVKNKYPKFFGIKVERIACNYLERLYSCNDIFVDIPDDADAVIRLLKSKNRHNIQKK